MPKAKSQNIKYVMNLNESMVNKLITKVEGSIIEIKNQQAAIQPDLDKAKAAFEAIVLEAKKKFEHIQQQWDAFNDQLNEENLTLEALVKFKTQTGANKQLNVYTSISNTNKKIKRPKRFNFKWTPVVLELLAKEKKFFGHKDLVKEVVSRTPELQKLNLSDAEQSKTSFYLRTQAINNKSGLTLYKDKVGLQEWLNNGTVKPEFLTQFMG